MREGDAQQQGQSSGNTVSKEDLRGSLHHLHGDLASERSRDQYERSSCQNQQMRRLVVAAGVEEVHNLIFEKADKNKIGERGATEHQVQLTGKATEARASFRGKAR